MPQTVDSSTQPCSKPSCASGGLAVQLLGGPIAGLVGVATGAAQSTVRPADAFYFDNLLSFINYKMDFTNGRHDMLVINEFAELFNLTFSTFGGTVPDMNAGIMRIKNFDFVGSYTGQGQVALTNLPDTAIAAALTGGGNAFGPMIDLALTGSAYATRYVKAMQWSAGADPLVLDLTGRGLNTTALDGSGVHFDLNNNFFAERTEWIGAGANDNKIQNLREVA